MSEAKFTKGPWVARNAPKNLRVYRIDLGDMVAVGADGECVAFVPAVARHHEEEREHNFPSFANARLIAAAPEMYELVKGLCDIARPNDSINETFYELGGLKAKAMTLLARIDGTEGGGK